MTVYTMTVHDSETVSHTHADFWSDLMGYYDPSHESETSSVWFEPILIWRQYASTPSLPHIDLTRTHPGFIEIKPEALKGNLAGLFKYREGDYRIIYQPLHKEKIIVIHEIGHRSEIYKKAKP